MKHCPYCAEEIQDEAILCRYCGKKQKDPATKPNITLRRIGWIILGVFASAALIAGWVLFFTTKANLLSWGNALDNQLKIVYAEKLAIQQELDTSNQTIAQNKSAISELQTTLSAKEEELETTKADLRKTTAKFNDTQNELLLTRKLVDCETQKHDFSYRDNRAMLAELADFLKPGDPLIAEKSTSNFEVLWTNSDTAMHHILGEYGHYFLVTYNEPDLENSPSVYWVDRSCYVDR